MSLSFNKRKGFSRVFATIQKYFFPNLLLSTRNAATQSLPIEWKRPKRIRFDDPINTGDGVISLPVDMKKSPVIVEQSKEITTADELVKRLFTFEFLGRKYAMKRAQDEMIELVRNHKYDRSSPQAGIAKKTAAVRNLLEHHRMFPRDLVAKTHLNTIIGKRQKALRLLRQWDYKSYEWILEKLDLYYVPHAETFDPITRKIAVKRLTNQYCEAYKQQKLQEYMEVLESQKLDFLKEKIALLEWIKKEEIECGVTPSVTDQDIDAAKEQLSEHMRTLASKPIKVDTSRNILSDE